MKKKIVIIAGDPNSINSEIIYKTWKNLNNSIKKNLYIIGNYNLIKKQFKKLKIKQKIIKLENIEFNKNIIDLKIINIPLLFKKPFDVPLNSASKYVLSSLDLGHKLSMQEKIKGIINCPIDKKLIKKTKKPGVTELLASKCKLKNSSEVMMIHNKKLSVVPITTHISLKRVSSQLNKHLVINKTLTLNNGFIRLFKKKPKIGILGLNPHNGELNKKSEEIKHIIPAISYLKKKMYMYSGR